MVGCAAAGHSYLLQKRGQVRPLANGGQNLAARGFTHFAGHRQALANKGRPRAAKKPLC
jgi:hypothetical protein